MKRVKISLVFILLISLNGIPLNGQTTEDSLAALLQETTGRKSALRWLLRPGLGLGFITRYLQTDFGITFHYFIYWPKRNLLGKGGLKKTRIIFNYRKFRVAVNQGLGACDPHFLTQGSFSQGRVGR